jgi:hypothetical protein
MTQSDESRGPRDTAEGQSRSDNVNTAFGPGPVLDPAVEMPIFNDNERAGRDIHSVIDPDEFTELGQRIGDELDHIASIGDLDEAGVAERGAETVPSTASRSHRPT